MESRAQCTVAIAIACISYAWLAPGAEYVIDVPEGEVVTNAANVNAAAAGDVLVKTGKGTWYSAKKTGDITNFSKMEVREGVFENAGGTGYFFPPLVEIFDGAVLKQLGSASYSGRNVTIQIDKGGTFNDEAGALGFGGVTEVKGSGLLVNANGTVKAGTMPEFSGDIVAGRGADSALYIGDGANAENDPDLSGIGSFEMAGGKKGVGAYPRVYFKNVKPMVVTNRFGGLGQLFVNAGSTVTFSNLWKTYGSSAALEVKGTMTNVNGRLSLGSSSSCFNLNNVNARYVQIGGVAYGAWPKASAPTEIPYTKLKHPDGSQMAGSMGSGYGTRILENGAKFYTQYQQPYRTEVNSGSELIFCGGGLQMSNATSATDRIEFKFDGGALRLARDAGGGMAMTYPSGWTPPRFVIGAKGMTVDFVGQGSGSPAITFSAGAEVKDYGSGGALKFRGEGYFNFYSPLDICGTVTVEDGTVNINNNAAYYAENAKPALGTGDVALLQGRIASYLPTGRKVRLADGPGSKLRLRGSATLNCTVSAGNDWQIGPTNAAETSIVREKGAALFFDCASANSFANGKCTCIVGGGLPLGANGKLPVLPVFVTDSTSTRSGDTSFGGTEFLTQGENGLVRFDGYETAFGGNASDVVYVGSATALSSDATVAAVQVGKSVNLQVKSGVRLTVGDGTGTACVLLNTGSITGPGTLDFGSSEGVVAMARRNCTIGAAIAGSGGVSFVGSYLTDVNAWGIKLTAENTYTGGTRISSTRVKVASGGAFGAGDVWALGGDGNGGQIMFDNGAAKVTLTNGLHLSGRGMKFGYTDVATKNHRMGAIWARSPVELTGAVELAGPTRIVVSGRDTELKASGAISGDAVQFFNMYQAVTNFGTVVYAAENTYTGGTEVVRATLVLEPGASAGTGEIVLDGGRLVLKAGAGGVDLPNVLRGAGTVVLDGLPYAPTTFAAGPKDDPFFQQEHELDANGRNRVVNSLAGFTSVTNSGSRVAHLSVTDDAEGSFKGEVSENVVVHYGMAWAPGMLIRVY